jgi:hypothetical protein
MRQNFLYEHLIHYILLLRRILSGIVKFVNNFSDDKVFINKHVKEAQNDLMVVNKPAGVLILE